MVHLASDFFKPFCFVPKSRFKDKRAQAPMPGRPTHVVDPGGCTAGGLSPALSSGRSLMSVYFKNRRKLEQRERGLWGCHLVAFAEWLQVKRYAQWSIRRKLQVAADFNQWLQRKKIRAHQIAPGHTSGYLLLRRRAGLRDGHSVTSALHQYLELLCERGVITKPPSRSSPAPIEKLLIKYDLYLEKERALALATRICYRPYVRDFLLDAFGRGRIALSLLRAINVLTFVRRHAPQLKGKRVQLMTAALRSFLRFARYRGMMSRDLASCVPTVACRALSTVPKALPQRQVRQVLSACNRKTTTGKRDYAILLLLARLGLRSGEVARLTLDDVDWETGGVKVHGKAGRIDQLPLPTDVGTAIVTYLKARKPPGSATRRLFLYAHAPFTGFRNQKAVGAVVGRALAKAGIAPARKSAHQFRHALASELLRQGRSLAEIGEVLRHRNSETTAIYAKVDIQSLRSLALPWPGGGR